MPYTIRGLLLFPKTVYISHGTTLGVEKQCFQDWLDLLHFRNRPNHTKFSTLRNAKIKGGEVAQVFVLIYKRKLC